eukprot:2623792-Rhodomonas_salina.1
MQRARVEAEENKSGKTTEREGERGGLVPGDEPAAKLPVDDRMPQQVGAQQHTRPVPPPLRALLLSPSRVSPNMHEHAIARCGTRGEVL